MGVILLEALAALVILVFIVWWTMFSGRPKGEPPTREQTLKAPPETTLSAEDAAASDGPTKATTQPSLRDKV